MALEGNLEDFELTDVFQLIQLGAKDGSLRIQSPDDVGVVYFKGGMVIHAKTNAMTGEPAVDSILRWRKGRFVFNPGEQTFDHTVDLPIQQVILEAARRIDELIRIQKVIPTFDVIVRIVEVPDAGVEKIDLRPDEWKVLAFIDGTLSVKQISQRVNISEFEAARILFGLVSSGLVKIVPRVVEEKKPLPPVPPPAKNVKKDDDDKKGIFGIFKKK
jgi:hypothetical protein